MLGKKVTVKAPIYGEIYLACFFFKSGPPTHSLSSKVIFVPFTLGIPHVLQNNIAAEYVERDLGHIKVAGRKVAASHDSRVTCDTHTKAQFSFLWLLQLSFIRSDMCDYVCVYAQKLYLSSSKEGGFFLKNML